jgi:hypothetical protein
VGSIHFCANEIVSTKTPPKSLKKSWDLSAGIFISMILQNPQNFKNQKSKQINQKEEERSCNEQWTPLLHSLTPMTMTQI